MTMTEFRVTGVKAGYHTRESLSTRGEGRGGRLKMWAEWGEWGEGGWSRGHRMAAEDIGPSFCPSISEEIGRTIGSPFQKTTVTDSFPTGEGKICRRELRLEEGEGGGRQRRSEGVHVAMLLGLGGGWGEKKKQLPTPRVPASSFLPSRGGGARAKRATIFFSYILTCDFSVPECINSRGLFNY